jgi:hypothetical protein
MYGLLNAQDTDIKENDFCNIITKVIFMSLNGLNLSNYGYIMSMYGFSDTIYIPKALVVMQLVEINQTQL